ncbi:MAG: DUF3179 domain-containing protein [Anaerolineae bacterium]|nr:DUF3179 domain-containing protein [Anaerolineae bacterium]
MPIKILQTITLVFLMTCLLLSACSPSVQELDPSETADSTSTDTLIEADVPYPDDQATQLMYMLSQGRDPDPQEAIDTILAAGDTRFVSVLIELMRLSQIGVQQGLNYQTLIDSLETLSGQSFGDSWPAWIEWYGATTLTPPPGFTGWKGELLSAIDPGFGEFLQDDYSSTIRVEEIQWGGVRVDGIPALDNATMIPADEQDYLDPDEPVFGISINGDHRAYPLRILDWHEMANDVVGGVPVSLAYCTLCGAGIAFDGRASNGDTYTFGSSGFLFRSNKLMYDRQTRTLWNQITGEPVLGELVGTDLKLDLLPVVLTSWESWLSQHPDTVVLDLDTGYQRPYTPGAAYGKYFADDDTMFPVWQRSSLLETKDRIYALQVESIPKAYPVDLLVEEQVVNDTIGETNVVLIAARDDINVKSGPILTYNAGGEVRAFDRKDQTFKLGPDANTLLDSAGRSWQITEEALVSPDGELAPRINGHLAYWFGWYSFFPKTLLYGQE